MEQRRGGRGYMEAALGALVLAATLTQHKLPSTTAFASMERVKDKLQASPVGGEVLAERFYAVSICSFHRMLVRTFASKENETPYHFQEREVLRNLVSGERRFCAFGTSHLSCDFYGGIAPLLSARPPTFGTRVLAR